MCNSATTTTTNAGLHSQWRDGSARHGQAQDGFGLVEVLVTLVLLSVGLLGLAALQGQSQRTTYSAYLRSQAAVLAYDMLDLMRSNRTVATASSYDLTSTSASCTSAAGVTALLCDWRTRLGNLPNASGRVRYDSVTRIITVEVSWDDSRAGGGAHESLTVQTQL
ncbi:MAG: type IV pilus modification protein PilV [Burkholderiales bacterium]|nr:type IV pilus modification protein PilV [Burkholderiales bacterium]